MPVIDDDIQLHTQGVRDPLNDFRRMFRENLEQSIGVVSAAKAAQVCNEALGRILDSRCPLEPRSRAWQRAGTEGGIAADPIEPMTPGEIQAEIDAYRSQSRSAAGS